MTVRLTEVYISVYYVSCSIYSS